MRGQTKQSVWSFVVLCLLFTAAMVCQERKRKRGGGGRRSDNPARSNDNTFGSEGVHLLQRCASSKLRVAEQTQIGRRKKKREKKKEGRGKAGLSRIVRRPTASRGGCLVFSLLMPNSEEAGAKRAGSAKRRGERKKKRRVKDEYAQSRSFPSR